MMTMIYYSRQPSTTCFISTRSTQHDHHNIIYSLLCECLFRSLIVEGRILQGGEGIGVIDIDATGRAVVPSAAGRIGAGGRIATA